MLKAFNATTTRSRRWINFLVFSTLFCFLLSACSLLQTQHSSDEPARLTERDVTYQKGLALFSNAKYAESSPFFLKVTQTPQGGEDEEYNSSLWHLSLIYEKSGEFEKSVLALLELENRNPASISMFRLKTALAKNYIRLENRGLALKIEKEIHDSAPTQNNSVEEIYSTLAENSDFNYDNLMLEELQFLGEMQKYFIFVMESEEPKLNQSATDLLISLYDHFFKSFEKDTYNHEFKKSLAIELLEQLRLFDIYKVNGLSTDPNTISKFSNYSQDKQKFLTDWLHR